MSQTIEINIKINKRLDTAHSFPAVTIFEEQKSSMYHQLIKPTPVSTHFNQPGHSGASAEYPGEIEAGDRASRLRVKFFWG